MHIIKEVEVKIESIIDNLDSAGLPEGEAEKSRSTASGFLHIYNEKQLITFTENGEGGRIDSEIACEDGAVRVKRMGAIESDLCFKEGEHFVSVYSIPPYKFDADVLAKRVRVDIGTDGGNIDLLYNMKIGGAEKSARMKIWISTNSNPI